MSWITQGIVASRREDPSSADSVSDEFGRFPVTLLPSIEKNKAALSAVQTIAIAGGKGGVGKTNVAVNLAVCLGAADHQVLLLDGDLGLGNVDRLLSLRPTRTLSDVFAGKHSLSEVLIQGPRNVTVVPSASGRQEMTKTSQIEHAGLIGLFSDLPTSADTLIVDIATGLSDSVLSFCQAVREVIVVVVDEPTALLDAFTTVRVLYEKCSVRRFRIVANKTESSQHGLDVFAALSKLVDQHMDVLLDYCGSIPFDQYLKQAVCEQRSVVEAYPRSPSTLAFRKLSVKAARWPRPQTPCGHIEFFVERLINVADSNRYTVRKTSV
jgi:flagellar biosynthesis protein FlhG